MPAAASVFAATAKVNKYITALRLASWSPRLLGPPTHAAHPAPRFPQSYHPSTRQPAHRTHFSDRPENAQAHHPSTRQSRQSTHSPARPLHPTTHPLASPPTQPTHPPATSRSATANSELNRRLDRRAIASSHCLPKVSTLLASHVAPRPGAAADIMEAGSWRGRLRRSI